MLPMFTSMRDFDSWLASFRPSIADYKYYTDFNKVFNNVDAIKIPLNILNSLIGSKNIEEDFKKILTQYPETLNCIPILLAKREFDIMAMDEEGQIYNPQIQISAESETKRSIFREKDKTKRSKKESAQHSKSRNKSFVMTSVSAL